MALWTVVVQVKINETLEFEHEIEADSKDEAKEKAIDLIDEEAILDKLAEGDVAGLATYDGEAETEEVQCAVCEDYFPKDQLNDDGICEDCVEDDDEEEGEESK